MACRENKTVAVEPFRGVRVVIESLAKQNGSYFSTPEWESKVARRTGVYGVDGESACLRRGVREDGIFHIGIWVVG